MRLLRRRPPSAALLLAARAGDDDALTALRAGIDDPLGRELLQALQLGPGDRPAGAAAVAALRAHPERRGPALALLRARAPQGPSGLAALLGEPEPPLCRAERLTVLEVAGSAALSPGERAAARAHRQSCSRCRALA